nr:MAG TPA: hypothetical protein [Caudoviricetes sp.]
MLDTRGRIIFIHLLCVTMMKNLAKFLHLSRY